MATKKSGHKDRPNMNIISQQPWEVNEMLYIFHKICEAYKRKLLDLYNIPS